MNRQLYQRQLDTSMEYPKNDLQWLDPAEDPFDSFIDPHSFDIPGGGIDRKYSLGCLDLFDVLPASGESDNIDHIVISNLDAYAYEAQIAWQDPAWPSTSFIADAKCPALPDIGRPYFSDHAAEGKSISSHTDLLGLKYLDPHLSDHFPQPSSPFPTPGLATKSSDHDYSLPITTKPRGSSTRVQKHTRQDSSSSRRMSSRPSARRQHELWAHKLQELDVLDQLNIKTPYGQYSVSSPPPSTRFQSHQSFSYRDEELDSDEPFHSDVTIPEQHTCRFSSHSSNYTQFQHRHTQSGSSVFELTGRRDSLQESPQPGHQLSSSSYPSTPQTEDTSYPMTPPPTQPMISHQFKHDYADVLQSEKAESWWPEPLDQSEMNFNAPPTTRTSGLGISNISSGSTNLGPRFSLPSDATLMLDSMAPTRVHLQHGQSSFSASALSTQRAIYPMPPLDRHQANAQMLHNQHMMLQEQAQRMTYHGRYPMTTSSISPLAITSSKPYPSHPYLNDRTPSLNSNSRTPSLSPSPDPQQRPTPAKPTKTPRKYSTKASIRSPAAPSGFINFTPNDSRRILTGVAPSGSSKTKARREKEAAEKRRKLSEAAKKAILEAGGDLASLEREGVF